jgi:type IV pilus assembly protein PilE
MKRISGFSLIELLVAVAIVSILAAVAIPGYRDYVIRGKLTEAYSTLSSTRVQLEQFYQDRRTYTGGCTNGTVSPQPTGNYFTYACNINDQTYTVTATGVTSKGVSSQFVFNVDQNNNRKTTSAPSGWMANANCWIRSKDGSC